MVRSDRLAIGHDKARRSALNLSFDIGQQVTAARGSAEQRYQADPGAQLPDLRYALVRNLRG
jgi:hypothetical protein